MTVYLLIRWFYRTADALQFQSITTARPTFSPCSTFFERRDCRQQKGKCL